ncbi:hypothetical protein F53441_5040 [Fusarium austroafricanum]|uniref:Heterokaryon incompatibility domain-containing protein n=1 Tax=Fusarium austroafricanum TaxID=2364996 RepID=A0A8H4KJ28_9HYPO|nr:hypothetical protein F53441_5040 [Fusarium austroafricanum]
MHYWHAQNCKKPDIALIEGLGAPTCMNCGEISPLNPVDSRHGDELKIPPGPKRSAMYLTWPLSVPYLKKAYNHDRGGVLQNALISQLDRNSYEMGLDQDMSDASCAGAVGVFQDTSPERTHPIYEPLQGPKMRVLKLHQGHFGSCLHGDFETIDLQVEDRSTVESDAMTDDDPNNRIAYEAVSYTWSKGPGKRGKDHVIYIGKWWDILPITENCFDALQNCRLKNENRRLWVDAICINQSDISERTHQVGIMRDIYSAANRVLIYLGIDNTLGGSEVECDPQSLSHNSYFSRIWVVQEIASAKQAEVLHARQSMSWNFFHRNLRHLSIKKWMRHFDQPRQIEDVHLFLTLLEDTRDCNASDPRDKMFALLGLWKVDLDPDYTLSTQAVYTGLASRLVIDKDQEVAGRLLDMASHRRSMPGLPSWVPDWSVKSQQPYHRGWHRDYPIPGETWPRYRLAKAEIAHQKFRVHGQTGSLCVSAVEIDTLAPFLSHGFWPSFNEMVTSTAGQTHISVVHEVQLRCRPTDRIFALNGYKFCLILRKVADPRIHTFIGLCEYKSRGTAELDAIRYLQDWVWLLNDGRKWRWTELISWEKAGDCWSTLREQRRLERRVCLQRLVLKAYLAKKVEDLAEDARYFLSNPRGDEHSVWAYFQQRWNRIYQRWWTAENTLVSHQQKGRSLIRTLLPGYKSLEPSTETLETTQLDQSMWLPATSNWFHWSERVTKDKLSSRYPLLAACAAKHIPFPPLHLVNETKRQIVLSINLELETGLRQLQRVAHEHFPQESPLSRESLSRSYKLYTCYDHNLQTDYWAMFLRWLSKPAAPGFDILKEESNLHSLLVWETRLKTQQQIRRAHLRLDANFDHRLEKLASTSWLSNSLDNFFGLVYQEQFELFWLSLFSGHDVEEAMHMFPAKAMGAEFARAFFWRFDRSISKACKLAGIEDGNTKKHWTKFLKWLGQGSFDPHAKHVPSDTFDPYPRPDEARVDRIENVANRFLNVLKYDGTFILPQVPENLPTDSYYLDSDFNPQPEDTQGGECLSELVHSEIRRRRLAERVFSFLFEDTEQSAKPRYVHFRTAVNSGKLPILDEPFIERWREQEKSWKTVEEYISESEWHMTSLKTKILGGLMEDEGYGKYEDVYKDIVII